MKRIGTVLWGLILVVVGTIFILNTLEITDINIFFTGWWTLFIIIPSFIGLFKPKGKLGSSIWLVIGILLLLVARDILTLSLIGQLILPIILIMVGLNLMFKGLIVSSKMRKLKVNKVGAETYASTFSGQSVEYKEREFKGAKIDAIFGSVDLIIDKAQILENQSIDATAVFGGILIKVPQNVNVTIVQTGIFGGVTDKTLGEVNENNKTICIRANALFGGVKICQ